MEWKNPPGSSRGLAVEAAELRRNPGRWGMITYTDRDKARKHRERILNGKASAFKPKGAFEADLRYAEDSCELYIRYIGEEGQHATASTLNWSRTGPGSGSEDRPADAGAGSEVDLHGTA